MKLIELETLVKRRQWTLERKVAEAKKRIIEWYEAFNGMVYIAFSGGLDSTVLVHLVRSVFADVPAVFSNTGLEYPENVHFVKTIDNVQVIRPAMPFARVVEKWGYPMISKRVAQFIHEVQSAKGDTATKRLRLTGRDQNGNYSRMSKIPARWRYLCNAPFKISDRCCHEMKKKPAKRYHKKTGRFPFLGILAEESQQRIQTYLMHGCNRFDIKQPHSTPLSFWTRADIAAYIEKHCLPYSKIYDLGHKQTGCMFCLFGVHLDYQYTGTNRFILMKEQHPRHWAYCIDRLGIGAVMDYIRVPYEDKQLKLWAM